MLLRLTLLLMLLPPLLIKEMVFKPDEQPPISAKRSAAGFNGETARIELPDPETGEKREIVLRKTYMVRYSIPGSLELRGSEPLKPRDERWIMR